MIFLIQFDCSGLRNLNGGNIINVWLHINGCSKVCCEKLFFTGTEPPAREHRENIQAPVGSSRGWFFVSSACSATPQPEVGLERKLLERTRKTILVGLPSQPKPGSFGKLAKEQKKKLKKKKIRLLERICQPGFQAKGIWSSIWMFQRLSKPGQETPTPCSCRSSALWAGLSVRIFLHQDAQEQLQLSNSSDLLPTTRGAAVLLSTRPQTAS